MVQGCQKSLAPPSKSSHFCQSMNQKKRKQNSTVFLPRIFAETDPGESTVGFFCVFCFCYDSEPPSSCDIIQQKCLQRCAAYVIAPCCYGKLQHVDPALPLEVATRVCAISFRLPFTQVRFLSPTGSDPKNSPSECTLLASQGGP